MPMRPWGMAGSKLMHFVNVEIVGSCSRLPERLRWVPSWSRGTRPRMSGRLAGCLHACIFFACLPACLPTCLAACELRR